MIKKTLFLILVLTSVCTFGQQKGFLSGQYLILISNTQKLVALERGNNFNTFSLYTYNNTKLFDCYDGVFCFADTLTASDAAQQGTTGIWKITPHSSLVSTTKRNILVNDLLLQYDTGTQQLVLSPHKDTNFPIKIISISTGIVSLTIYSNKSIYWNVLPTSFSVIGSSGIKKIIVN